MWNVSTLRNFNTNLSFAFAIELEELEAQAPGVVADDGINGGVEVRTAIEDRDPNRVLAKLPGSAGQGFLDDELEESLHPPGAIKDLARENPSKLGGHRER